MTGSFFVCFLESYVPLINNNNNNNNNKVFLFIIILMTILGVYFYNKNVLISLKINKLRKLHIF
ncbi:MAG: hypothetical protein N7Q72_02280, partial [Spiroplasma sp. Tabriz.8]|nr:hypothetical protein [Candidatus Regiella insecticola]MCZ8632072.1 hypothetical protein [Spiroplasma sp. Tabriz.8]